MHAQFLLQVFSTAKCASDCVSVCLLNLMQHFDQRPHQGSTDAYSIVSFQGGYYVMYGAMVGCGVCEGFAFSLKKCTST